jgi:hypothetical protein
MPEIGDSAQTAGYQVVPEDGEDGRVRWGAREINRTRDYLAEVKGLIPDGRTAYRSFAGITYGTTAPTSTPPPGTTYNEGDIYFQVINTTTGVQT